ncbi:putative serine proteinase inhibitor [Penaeus vannamei]|uniref:Putative serine proteinase inhibitor n=1 Tax=Penaeus vannamei TaxID=6689 RepID=A0A3R7MKU5_PENVA|nr:putative serine proteinase inhibitor [Penaeus vannamei]
MTFQNHESVRAAPRPRPPVTGQLSVPLLLRHLAAPRLPILKKTTPFSLDLLKKALPPTGNFFISPFSVWSALVLAYFGSRGNTKAELEQVLRLTNRRTRSPCSGPSNGGDYDSQEANQNYTINSANRIYFDQSIPVRECVGKVLDDKVKLIDFKRPDAAAADINAFINAETRGKIPKLIEPSFVKDAKMVLTNAVYFKGFWKYPFNPQRTHKDNFFINPKAALQVDMMSQTGNFKYVDSEKLRAQVLEMPYKGDAVSMVVLLPRSGRAKEVDRLVRRLRPRRLVSVLKAMPSVPVRVKFPKIIVESALEDELISTLKNMGIRDLFSSAADLTDFTHVRGLMVNRAIHKALIEVDEEGAEAAAATVLVITKSSNAPKTTFTCNRPFVFYIKDNEANNILFMGVYRGL